MAGVVTSVLHRAARCSSDPEDTAVSGTLPSEMTGDEIDDVIAYIVRGSAPEWGHGAGNCRRHR